MKALFRQLLTSAADAIAGEDKCPACGKHWVRENVQKVVLSKRYADEYKSATKYTLLGGEDVQEKVRVQVSKVQSTYRCSSCGHNWAQETDESTKDFIEEL